jgi:hypothetical protein
MFRRIVAGVLGVGLVGGMVLVQPAEARPTQVEVSGHDVFDIGETLLV